MSPDAYGEGSDGPIGSFAPVHARRGLPAGELTRIYSAHNDR